MSARELLDTLVDLQATPQYLLFGDLRVEVRCTDIKVTWGNVRVRVTPVAGGGDGWVYLSSLKAGAR